MHTRIGYYINLDRSPDRRDFMEQQIRSMDLAWVGRFVAMDGMAMDLAGDPRTRGISASFLSHLRLLEQAPEDTFTFVFEDDIEISPALTELLSVQNLSAVADHDLIFLDCQPCCESPHLRRCWQALKHGLKDSAQAHDLTATRSAWRLSLYAAQGMYSWGAAAYVVTPKGRTRLIQAMREHWQTGEVLAADMVFLRLLQSNRINAAIFMPFLASPVPTERLASVVEHGGAARGVNPQAELVGSLLRRLFFAGPVPDVLSASRALGLQAGSTHDAADLLATLAGQHFRHSLTTELDR